jgi:hypothetical protein
VNGRPVDPGRSRIVLVGTPAYLDPGLPDVPAVASNVTDLAAVLTDPEVGGFDAAHCFVSPAGAGTAEVGSLLVQAAAEAEDLLFFYYSGHGLLGTRSHELYLSLSGTRPDQVAFTALPFTAVRDACLDSRAASRVVILDSCFSGRAIGDILAGAEEEVMGQVAVSGTYTLTSAPANRTALILPGERHTAFTERLLRLLRDGSPQAGDMLSLGDIYRSLNARLRAEGLPVPQQRGTETADLLGLVRNHSRANTRHLAGTGRVPDLRASADAATHPAASPNWVRTDVAYGRHGQTAMGLQTTVGRNETLINAAPESPHSAAAPTEHRRNVREPGSGELQVPSSLPGFVKITPSDESTWKGRWKSRLQGDTDQNLMRVLSLSGLTFALILLSTGLIGIDTAREVTSMSDAMAVCVIFGVLLTGPFLLLYLRSR